MDKKDNIKLILREIGCEYGDWTEMPHDISSLVKPQLKVSSGS